MLTLAGSLVVLISVVLCLNSTLGAPRSKSRSREKPSSTTYDQKQTGEYNIQLHLKDFQIIAVVGEDSLGMGDYDYNYDYSEFTVKPQGVNSSTLKPTDFESILIIANQTTSQNTTQTTTKKPFMHQYFSTTTKKPSKTTSPTTPKTQVTTKEPIQINLEETSVSVDQNRTTTSALSPVISSSTTAKSELTSFAPPPPNASTDKIPVAIHDYNEAFDEVVGSNLRKHDETKTNNELLQRPHVTNVAIVPSEDFGAIFEDDPEPNDQLTLGEIMQYRRCAVGYARDKRGRCRKIRRPAGTNPAPQLPLGITRFASNLAARFRQATSSPTDNLLQHEQQYSSSESNEPSS